MMDNPYLVPVVVIGVFFIGVIGLMIHSVRRPSREELFRRHGERMQEPQRSGIDHAAGGVPADVGFSGDGGWGDGGGGGGDGGGGGGDGGGH